MCLHAKITSDDTGVTQVRGPRREVIPLLLPVCLLFSLPWIGYNNGVLLSKLEVEDEVISFNGPSLTQEALPSLI